MAALRDSKSNRQRWQLLPPSWRAIADGSRPLEELTDDEVFKGRLLNPNGHGYNPRPQFYPQNFIDEQIRRSLD